MLDERPPFGHFDLPSASGTKTFAERRLPDADGIEIAYSRAGWRKTPTKLTKEPAKRCPHLTLGVPAKDKQAVVT